MMASLVMSGAGVHSGLNDNTKFSTFGCIRTTDAAMKQIRATAKNDSIRIPAVINNKSNATKWFVKYAADRNADSKELKNRYIR